MCGAMRGRLVTILLASAAGFPTWPSLGHAITLTDEQLAAYDRDGVVLVKGVLTGRKLRRAQRIIGPSGWSLPGWLKVGLYDGLVFQGWRSSGLLRSVACDSTVPDLVAQVMRLGPDERLRVLKDAAFSFKPGDKGVGWHLDDKRFWPCHDSAPDEDARLEGVNVWITLSPLTAAEGGGLAVAPGSARASWCEKARNI
jgi:hypothetical protein